MKKRYLLKKNIKVCTKKIFEKLISKKRIFNKIEKITFYLNSQLTRTNNSTILMYKYIGSKKL